MVKLYTAVGRCELKNSSFYVITNNEEKCISPYEKIIWSLMVWNIRTRDEAQEVFENYIAEILDADRIVSFDDVFNRLVQRKLIIRGAGLNGLDALQNLLEQLLIVPISNSIIVYILTVIGIIIKYKSFAKARYFFSRRKMAPDERRIYNLSKIMRLSTDVMIECIIKIQANFGKFDTERYEMQRLSVLGGVATLYKKKMIMFDLK